MKWLRVILEAFFSALIEWGRKPNTYVKEGDQSDEDKAFDDEFDIDIDGVLRERARFDGQESSTSNSGRDDS